jgi:hypothetical protein
LIAVGLFTSLCVGQPQVQGKKDEEPINVIPFKDTEVGINVCAMIACVGAAPQGGPLAILGTRILAGSENIPLTKWQFAYEFVPPLDQVQLDRILDGRLLPDLRQKEFKELPPADRAFYRAYLHALIQSNRSTKEMFDKSAEDYQHVVYSHLAADPKRYRGKVISIKGKLSAIQKYDAPQAVQGEGLHAVFSGYVIGPTKGAPPFTIVFTELPQGVLKETENLNRDVTFSGYFLAHVRYPADKDKVRAKKDVISPYLVGKTVTLLPVERKIEPPPEDKTANSYYILAWTVGGIISIAVMVALMNMWFRRGDRVIHSRLAEMRDRQQPFNLEAAEEPPPAPDPNEEGIKPMEPPMP